jgi:hypothetical protein
VSIPVLALELAVDAVFEVAVDAVFEVAVEVVFEVVFEVAVEVAVEVEVEVGAPPAPPGPVSSPQATRRAAESAQRAVKRASIAGDPRTRRPTPYTQKPHKRRPPDEPEGCPAAMREVTAQEGGVMVTFLGGMRK